MWVCGGKVLPPRTQTWITIITAVKSKDLSDSEGQQVKTLSVTFCPKLQGHAIAIYTRNIRDIVKLTEGCQQNVNLETWPQPFCQRHSSRCVIDLCCSRKPASVIYYTSFHKNIGEPWHHIKTLLDLEGYRVGLTNEGLAPEGGLEVLITSLSSTTLSWNKTVA